MMNNLFQSALRSKIAGPLRHVFRPLANSWPWPVGVRLASGLIIYVDLRSSIGRSILVQGTFDQALGDFLEKILKPGDIFIDVGANVGYYSMIALGMQGFSGEVHAFDVDYRALKCLEMSQYKNSLKNLFIYNIVLGKKPGIVPINMMAESGHTHVTDYSDANRRVPMLPLDAWSDLFSTRCIGAIKIDVEGFEMKVLKGAEHILNTRHPIVICEAIEGAFSRFGVKTLDMVNFMKRHGYWADELLGTNDRNLIFYPNRM